MVEKISPGLAETERSPERHHVFSPLDAFRSPETTAAARRKISMMLTEGNLLPPDICSKLTARMIEAGRTAKTAAEFEKRCQQAIDEEGASQAISENFDDRYGRARFLSNLVGPYLEGDVLDVGSGDGLVGQIVSNEHGVDTTLVDVVDINRTELPLVIFDGENLPLPSKCRGTVMLIGSLHHGPKPMQVLTEAVRVAQKRIIIVEPVCAKRTPEDILSAKLIDWMISRVMKRDDVPCPANILSAEEWRETFKKMGLKLVGSHDFDNGNDNVSERSWMFVVDV